MQRKFNLPSFPFFIKTVEPIAKITGVGYYHLLNHGTKIFEDLDACVAESLLPIHLY